MKNKKGFTLIEVLAVIIILAIILVIIAPKINEYYKDSVKRKNLQSAYGVRNALNQYYASYTGTFRGYTCEFPDNCSEIKLDGTVPIDGIVSITADGIISGFVRYDNNVFILDDEGVTASEYTTVPGDFFDFSYSTTGEQTFLIPATGYYKLEVWGAQGGSYNSSYRGGYGGYSSGVVNLVAGNTLYVNVGGNGVSGITGSLAGGYNGGGNGYGGPCGSDRYGASGGGATHIAFSTGTLASFDGNNDGVGSSTEIRNIIIVAGGGGGSHYMYAAYGSGASGGGYVGNTAAWTNVSHNYYVQPTGGTQNSGGSIGYSYSTRTITYAKFGQGQNFQGGECSEGSGGGGGFYGGGAGSFTPGAGGSGYIGNSNLVDGVMYCYGCAESNVDRIKTINSNGSNKDAGCPNGYSADAVSNCAKAGPGHARVTYLGNSL